MKPPVALVALFVVFWALGQPVAEGEDRGRGGDNLPMLSEGESWGLTEGSLSGVLDHSLMEGLHHADLGLDDSWAGAGDSPDGWHLAASPLAASFEPVDRKAGRRFGPSILEVDPPNGPVSIGPVLPPALSNGTKNRSASQATHGNWLPKDLATAGVMALTAIIFVIAGRNRRLRRGRRAKPGNIRSGKRRILSPSPVAAVSHPFPVETLTQS